MTNELKQIKKLYGEEMMHLCRELFPSILEQKGLLLSILEKNLAPTHSFANDIKKHNLYEEFKSWIYSWIDVEKKNQVITNKTPFELMNEAGYTLYECKSEEDIQSFRKYYAQDEVLCTIYNGGRLNRCYVFFAVKKNVDEIKRENFSNPKREDEYGISVISIQFSRESHTLSIKNRYNHTVNNPDATFSNNLENIIAGLTTSFQKYYGLNINQNSNSKAAFLNDDIQYIRANDGKYYRYNLEIDGIYYCENNIIIEDGNVLRKYSGNKERYLLIDNFIVDMKEKSIFDYTGIFPAFVLSIYDVGKVKKIYISKKGAKNHLVHICYVDGKEVKIEINQNNDIIGYTNNYVEEIANGFLYRNYSLREINLPQVKKVGDGFLKYNEQLISISLPQVYTIGNYFLVNNMQLSSISLPQVQIIGDCFLYNNEQLSSISLPQVQTIGYCFLYNNEQLSSISLPQVQIIGDCVLDVNKQLSSISLPQVQIIGDYFLYNNEKLSSISLPQIKRIGQNFLEHNNLINKKKIIQEAENRKNEEVNNQRNR